MEWKTIALSAVILGSLVGCGGEDPAAAPPSEAASSQPSEPAATETEASEPATAERPRSYRVQEGDTLSAIAVRFDTTVSALVEANDLDDPDSLTLGQRLSIPPRRQ
ncbi:MAG: LysM peptidoglycan-binding domain-containing protein [Actinomycetota bacterium]|jgi:LysM repeat protein|nr:LysM peptidoglycan-binding domain-containing protein [Euzebyales bacterium]MDQ3344491.1 LysM peptidoglycan-binding domain-containing protein [Actinomycetota bacterium]MDQ3529531.1 LysM peptidoglycan-binding domain-containing protein [Actinomycetota bacterium]